MTADQKRHKEEYIRLINQFENDFDNMTPADHKYFLRLQELFYKDFDPRIFSAYDTILEELEKIGNKSYSKQGVCSVFEHLIKIMGEDDFNSNFTIMADTYGEFDEFYFRYHKQFRQCDMYDIQGAEWISKTAIAKDPEKYEKRAEKRDGNVVGGYILYRIGGHLDMIFWNMIHADSEVWDTVLKNTYEKYCKSKKIETWKPF